MPIPLVDLRAQYKEISPEVEPVVRDIMAGGRFVLGPEVKKLEEEFARYCGVSSAVGVASGTDALILALEALGIGTDDEVIVPVNTFIATALAVTAVGAKPVFADIDPRSYNITAATAGKAISRHTRAVVPVHLYGQPADMDPLKSLAEKRSLLIVEDACQAHGAAYKGKKAGSLGNAGCFSFYPGKNLGAYGDGGMVVTDDSKLSDRIKVLRDMGRAGKYEHMVKGRNSRLDNLQAAILLVKLAHLDRWNEARRRWALLYHELLQGTSCVLPAASDSFTQVYHLFVIRVNERDKLAAFLSEKGIATGIHYPIPLHLQRAYSELGYRKGDFPVAEQIAEEILSLPMYPELGEDGVKTVAGAVRAFYS